MPMGAAALTPGWATKLLNAVIAATTCCSFSELLLLLGHFVRPTASLKDSQLLAVTTALVRRSAHSSAPGVCSTLHSFEANLSRSTKDRRRKCLVL